MKKTPEETLREKLNKSQLKRLDFLKKVLDDKSKFNHLINLDEEKIKISLNHIQSDLSMYTDG
ncbi:Mlp family lipoprotein [Borrelia puertoricensis]|uniref:Mlp family lipoprotein n=1 Tax=Borrelia puertoricensis TaxID=2756107 RepID=UPI003D312C40